jgi:cysteine protease avirulence protein AvrRpt2
MTFKMIVPKIAQDQTMSCWYAGACMVAYYREAGPRLGLPSAYAANAGVTAAQMRLLAKNEGLKDAALAAPVTAEELETALRQYGPLWIDGDWFGPAHIIVVTGVDTVSKQLIFNDPDGGVEKKGTVTWFNSKRYVANPPLYQAAKT